MYLYEIATLRGGPIAPSWYGEPVRVLFLTREAAGAWYRKHNSVAAGQPSNVKLPNAQHRLVRRHLS